MKRRSLLVGSLVGSVSPLTRAFGEPCPPSQLAIEGGPTMRSACGDLEADWLHRSTGPGVVWFHDFRSDSEVDAFFSQRSNVGGVVRRRSDDGITGNCLEVVRHAGTEDPPVFWRPFSPLSGAENGRGADDPAANGTIQIRTGYGPLNNERSSWKHGYYGHQSYHASYPGVFDGTEYWFQVRVKMDPNRLGSAQNIASTGGKLFYFTRLDRSLTSQEIVTVSGNPEGSPPKNYFTMYRSGSPGLSSDPPGVSVHGNQVNSELGYCRFNSSTYLANCWHWSGGWDTIAYHIRPGLDSNSDTLVQVWAAHPGEPPVKIWDQDAVDLPLDVIPGHGALIASGYMNGKPIDVEFFHRYCQMIFSKQEIPWPSA
jgi:hypothetical protein